MSKFSDQDTNYIKWMVMDGHGDAIRDLLITKQQTKVVKDVQKHGDMTTGRMAGLYDISSQNASNQLRRLYYAGYLARETVESATGGYEHVYSVADID